MLCIDIENKTICFFLPLIHWSISIPRQELFKYSRHPLYKPIRESPKIPVKCHYFNQVASPWTIQSRFLFQSGQIPVPLNFAFLLDAWPWIKAVYYAVRKSETPFCFETVSIVVPYLLNIQLLNKAVDSCLDKSKLDSFLYYRQFHFSHTI